MRVVSRNTLVDFWAQHPKAETSLRHWLQIAKAADWKSIEDVIATFSKAKMLNGEWARFEVSGGKYRMVVAFNFGRAIAFIKFIGTHKEYDKINALTVSKY
jgi:mRNA interferase HigB